MKKIYSTLALAVGLLSTTALSAENAPQSTIHHDKTEEHHEGHHAKWWAGGSMTFWKDTDRKVTNFSFRPEIGHFLSEKWGVGAMLNYTHYGSVVARRQAASMASPLLCVAMSLSVDHSTYTSTVA